MPKNNWALDMLSNVELICTEKEPGLFCDNYRLMNELAFVLFRTKTGKRGLRMDWPWEW